MPGAFHVSVFSNVEFPNSINLSGIERELRKPKDQDSQDVVEQLQLEVSTVLSAIST